MTFQGRVGTALGLAILLLAMCADTAIARTWTSLGRNFTIVGDFVEVSGGTIIIRRTSDGKLLRAPLDKLSEADQRFVEQLLEEQANAPAKRQPIPAVADRQKAAGLVEEAYGERFANTDAHDELKRLCQEVVAQANNTEGRPAQQYALFLFANKVATKGKDVDLAFGVIDKIDSLFEVDALAAKAKTLSKISKSMETSTAGDIATDAIALAETAVKAERYDAAIAAGRVAVAASRKVGDDQYTRAVVTRTKRISAEAAAFKQMQLVQDRLKTDPADAEANWITGSFRAFFQEKWGTGLPFLSRGNNAAIQTIAALELASAQNARVPTIEEQLKIADGWWGLAESENEYRKAALRRHAATWYEKAKPAATGLAKAKIDKRLAELAADQPVASPGTPTAPALQHVLGFAGNEMVRSNLKYNGKHPITMEAFVKPLSFGSQHQTVIGNFTRSGIALMLSDNRRWGLRIQTEDGARWLHAKKKAKLREWVHLVGQYDGQKMELFVNGERQGRVEFGNGKAFSKAPFGIGGLLISENRGKDFLYGSIASVHISKVLIYNDKFEPPSRFASTADTLLLWDMEEGQGNRARDASRNGNNGIILGARWFKLDE